MKSKIKIMTTRPEITDEEIRSYMDFDGVVREAKPSFILKGIQNQGKIASIIVGVIAVSWFTYFLLSSQNEVPVAEQLKPEIIKQVPNEPDQNGAATTLEETNPKNKTEKKNHDSSLQQKKEPGKEVITEAKTKSNEAELVPPVYKEAEPFQGFPHLYEYFNSELRYPMEAVKDSIQGIVTVTFIINREGKPEKIKILNSLGESFDKEALRLIENMPAWKPATLNDKAMPSKISLPLTFRIERIKK